MVLQWRTRLSPYPSSHAQEEKEVDEEEVCEEGVSDEEKEEEVIDRPTRSNNAPSGGIVLYYKMCYNTT